VVSVKGGVRSGGGLRKEIGRGEREDWRGSGEGAGG